MDAKSSWEQYLSLDQLQAWLSEAFNWLSTEILDLSTLVQFLVIFGCWALARMVMPKVPPLLTDLLNRVKLNKYSEKIKQVVTPLILPIIWLLLLWFSVLVAEQTNRPNHIIDSGIGLLTAWVVIRLLSGAVQNPSLSKAIAITAWGLAALNLLGLLQPVMSTLDSMGLSFGSIKITVLGALQAVIVLSCLLWIGGIVSQLAERRLSSFDSLSPSARVLLGKSIRIALIAVAFMIALNSVGIDLTALAVFSGAVGLGIGFGLQKVVSNLICGLILLVDKSVKPGDVIAIGDTFGWINSLKARHISVITRDGIEHLIPNEELISQPVENWSYSDTLVRMKIPIGISYDSDPRQAMELAEQAAGKVQRVETSPKPVCRFVNLGGDAVELELRVWIRDPQSGMVNVRSELLLGVWDAFKEHGIEFPFGQRDLHIRSSVPLQIDVNKN